MDPSHPFYQKLQKSKNVLLVKDDVGRAKKTVRNLPDGEHAYGSKPRQDKEGAGALISSWQIHQPTAKEVSEKDFKKLNRMSLENKLTSAKEVSHFVKENDVKVKEKRFKIRKSPEPHPNIEYYGVPNKPSTPISEVVKFEYGNKAEGETRKNYEIIQSEKVTKARLSPKNSEAKKTEPEERKEFKLKKFQNVESKVKSTIKTK